MSEEEMKALVEMNKYLKCENEKLKQEKKEIAKERTENTKIQEKEVIDKAIEFTNKKWGTWCTHHLEYMTELQDILKEGKMNKEQDLFEKTFDELWKREEYNFGTTDEHGYHNFDDYTEYPFAIDEMSILAEEYQKLKQQLQAYKDKEDKIRNEINCYYKSEPAGAYSMGRTVDCILQILNDKEIKDVKDDNITENQDIINELKEQRSWFEEITDLIKEYEDENNNI